MEFETEVDIHAEIEDHKKRIAEMGKIIDFDTERFRELGEEIQELKKRIAELEAYIEAQTERIVLLLKESGASHT